MGRLVAEILAILRLIPDLNFSTIWNNQFEYIKDGSSYSFPMPCSFVEVKNGELKQLSQNYQGSDLDIIIHIGQNVLNGDLLDENLSIFDLRDSVVKVFSNYNSETVGLIVMIEEEQDYDHTNVYHYKITFRVHWIDKTAVAEQYYTIPPIDGQVIYIE